MKVYFLKNPARVSRKSRSSIIVFQDSGKFTEVNIRDIEALIVVGSKVMLESGALNLLSHYNIPVAIVSNIGVTIASPSIATLYSETRLRQYTLPAELRLGIMREILVAKFKGFNNILSYHRAAPIEITEPGDFRTDSELLHWEAANSNRAWDAIIKLLPASLLEQLKQNYGFAGRKPRARDPFNKAVSLLYAVLYAVSTRALVAAGLDPTYGLLHKTRYSTALTFDYTEMFKPMAIHAVVKVLREGATLSLDENGYLDRDSMRKVSQEFFRIASAKIRGTRLTPYRQLYLCAYRLAKHIRTGAPQNYLFTYNPARLKLPVPASTA